MAETTFQVEITPNGLGAREAGALVIRRTKHTPERRHPEALPAMDAFGADPAALAALLAEHDSLGLSLCEVQDYVVLHLYCGHAALATARLGGLPDYWVGMGAGHAARKAGFLP